LSPVLLFGGSFDPIHHGHLIVARFAAERLGCPRVVLVPAAAPPHKPGEDLAPTEDRLAMCRLGVCDDPQFEVSDFETSRPGPNYTIETIVHFRHVLPEGAMIYWLVGSDTLLELGTWRRPRELVDLCTIVTAARPGFGPSQLANVWEPFSDAQIERLRAHVLPSPLIDISATEIRARVRAGQCIRYLTPEPVQRYIAERGLYR
jgi:nicotinate-nucleotide adenylyltransferase